MRFLRSICKALELAARLNGIAEKQHHSSTLLEALRAELDGAVSSGLLGKREASPATEPAALPGIKSRLVGGPLAGFG